MTKLAFIGPSGAGKDEAALWVASHTPLRYAFPTSRVIVDANAWRFGLTPDELYARRHEFRSDLRRLGDEMRQADPAHLARETLRHGDICVGVRALVEIRAVRREGLVDLIVWIERDVPEDPTLEFGPNEADVICSNNGTLEQFHARLERVARALGLSRT